MAFNINSIFPFSNPMYRIRKNPYRLFKVPIPCSTIYLIWLISLLMQHCMKVMGLFLAALYMMPSVYVLWIRALFFSLQYPLSARIKEPSGIADSVMSFSNWGLEGTSYTSPVK